MPLKILGSRIDVVSFHDALAKIQTFVSDSQPHHVITGNTLMLLEAEKNPGLRRILESAALVTPESSGIRWASRRLGQPLDEFIPGIDLMLAVCRTAAERGQSIYLLGSAPGTAEKAAIALRSRYPALKIVGTHHGYFQRSDDPSVIRVVRQARPDILFVGLGMPAQEFWIAQNLADLGVPVVMGVGGSFDVLSGKLRRAPAWMRGLGIEWLYRLTQEPWRWRRIAQLPVFAWRVLKESQSANRKSNIG